MRKRPGEPRQEIRHQESLDPRALLQNAWQQPRSRRRSYRVVIGDLAADGNTRARGEAPEDLVAEVPADVVEVDVRAERAVRRKLRPLLPARLVVQRRVEA